MIKKINKTKLIIFGLVVLLFFITLTKMNYSVDTYLLFQSKNLEYVQEYLKSGRILTVLFFKVLYFLRASPVIMYSASFVLAIICTTFSIYILNTVLEKYIKNEVICSIISIAIIINPFVIELWLFVEMGIMMLSILACVTAYKFFDEYIVSNDKKNIFITIICMIIALFSYQGTVAIFVALSIVSIVINNKELKSIIKNSIICLICYGIPTIINYVVVTLIGNKRINSKIDLVQKIGFIINSTKEQLLQGFGLYPTMLFITIHLVVLVIAIFSILRQNNKVKNLTKLGYIVFMTYFFTIATIFPQDINSVVMFPRNSYAFGSIVGLIVSFIMITNNSDSNKNDKNNVLLIPIIALLMIELMQFHIIETNRYIVNDIDKKIVLEINNKISDYEEKTGNRITNIAIYNEENSHRFYSNINDNINVSALSEEMSRKAMMGYYTRRELNSIKTSEIIYDKYFKNKTWKEFNLNQVILDGDTIHWYLY